MPVRHPADARWSPTEVARAPLGGRVTAGRGVRTVLVDVNWAAIAPIAVVALAFVVYCLVDLRRSTVRLLPKWAWALLCVLSIPLGGVLYLLVGREHR